MQLSKPQFDQLKGFYAHCYCVAHEGAKGDFGFWAQQLDNANIPWSVQNRVAGFAEDKQSRGFYLTTLLAREGIKVG